MRSTFLLLPLSLSAFSPLAGASGDDDLQTVVVTATRSEQPLERVGDSITLIEAAEVRASQKASLADLLATTPGVTLSRNGGLGGFTSIRIRGAEADQTVLLIDGIKLSDPASTGGGYDFGRLMTDELSRIEILRGPQSTLWGSQAMGGVINLVSPDPEGPLSAAATVEGGSFGTGRVQARLQAAGERVSWRLTGAHLRTDGISAFDERLGGSEDDGFRSSAFSGRARVSVIENVAIDLRASHASSRIEFDGFPPPDFSFADTSEYGRIDEMAAYAGLNVAAFAGRWRNHFGYAYTDIDRENFDPTSSVPRTFDARGENGRWEYQAAVDLARNYQAMLGLESETSRLRTSAPSVFDPNPVPLARDARLDSVYAQLQAAPLAALSLTTGLRHDDHETFGGKTTGRLALAWSAIENRTILRASYGEGFKAPTLYQLFSEYGNLALRPELAEGWDAGLEQRLGAGALVLSATYFDRRARDQIDFVSCFLSSDPRCASQPFGFFDNVQRTSAEGFELGAIARIGERAKLSANLTRTDATNDSAGSLHQGKQLARRPRNAGNAQLSYRWPRGLETAVAVQRVGSSYDDAANLVRLRPYTLVDLRATLTVSERLELFARLENALDEECQTTALYGSIGRGAFVGARASF